MASPAAISVLKQLPYLIYDESRITSNEFFGGSSAKDAMLFNLNAHWRFHNYFGANQNREFGYTKSETTPQSKPQTLGLPDLQLDFAIEEVQEHNDTVPFKC